MALVFWMLQRCGWSELSSVSWPAALYLDWAVLYPKSSICEWAASTFTWLIIVCGSTQYYELLCIARRMALVFWMVVTDLRCPVWAGEEQHWVEPVSIVIVNTFQSSWQISSSAWTNSWKDYYYYSPQSQYRQDMIMPYDSDDFSNSAKGLNVDEEWLVANMKSALQLAEYNMADEVVVLGYLICVADNVCALQIWPFKGQTDMGQGSSAAVPAFSPSKRSLSANFSV